MRERRGGGPKSYDCTDTMVLYIQYYTHFTDIGIHRITILRLRDSATICLHLTDTQYYILSNFYIIKAGNYSMFIQLAYYVILSIL
jgi:hypothetical protein